jgi:hypothetical protein
MRRRLLFFGLVLLLAVPLVLLFQGVTREVLVLQLWRFIQAVRILVAGVPQAPVWILFVGVVLFIAMRSLFRPLETQGKGPEEEVEYPGQVRILAASIERTAQGEYFRWTLARQVGELILGVLAYEERTTPEQMRQALRTDGLSLPPAIQTYLQVGFRPAFSRPTNLLSRLKRWLLSSIRGVPLSIDPSLERVIQFLEDQLEVDHDHRS